MDYGVTSFAATCTIPRLTVDNANHKDIELRRFILPVNDKLKISNAE